jgi:hypothetical protein
MAAHRIVAELVNAEDQEQRNGEGEAVGEAAASQRSAGVRERNRSGDGRGDERDSEQEQVKERVLRDTESPSSSAVPKGGALVRIGRLEREAVVHGRELSHGIGEPFGGKVRRSLNM